MNIVVAEEPISTLADYGKIGIAYDYDNILEPELRNENGLGGILLVERRLPELRTKDYDRLTGERPADWANRFDVSNWGMLVARSEETRVGGAVIAFSCPGLDMLENRTDMAVLWDIRVSKEYRGRSVGTLLFKAVEQWAQKRSCRTLKVETQNINLAACKFYARQGCKLGAINRFAYPELPGEIQLLWYKELLESGN